MCAHTPHNGGQGEKKNFTFFLSFTPLSPTLPTAPPSLFFFILIFLFEGNFPRLLSCRWETAVLHLCVHRRPPSASSHLSRRLTVSCTRSYMLAASLSSRVLRAGSVVLPRVSWQGEFSLSLNCWLGEEREDVVARHRPTSAATCAPQRVSLLRSSLTSRTGVLL